MCVVMFEWSDLSDLKSPHWALIILSKYYQNNHQCRSHVSEAADMVAA